MPLPDSRRRFFASLLAAVLLHFSLLLLQLPEIKLDAEHREYSVLSVALEKPEDASNEPPEQMVSASEPSTTFPPSTNVAQKRVNELEDNDRETMTSQSNIRIPSHSQIRQWAEDYVSEESVSLSYIDISQPRKESLAKSFLDAAKQRRKEQAAPARFQYSEGITRSFVIGNRKFCFLISSPAIGLSLQIQQVNCNHNLWRNPLVKVIPETESEYSPAPAQKLFEENGSYLD